MTKHIFNRPFHEYFEYHGNTMIERVKKRGGITVGREWLLFNSVEEAQDYFYEKSNL